MCLPVRAKTVTLVILPCIGPVGWKHSRSCWRKTKVMENEKVQSSAKAGLKHCKIYHKKTPKASCLYLKELGNSVNHQAAASTFMEHYRSTDEVEAGWKKTKQKHGWTVESVGQGALESKKMEYAEQVYPQRWGSHKDYERCIGCVRHVRSINMPEPKQTLWDAYSNRAKATVDFTDIRTQGKANITKLFKYNYKVASHLKQVATATIILNRVS